MTDIHGFHAFNSTTGGGSSGSGGGGGGSGCMSWIFAALAILWILGRLG